MASFVHIPGVELGRELGRGAYSIVYRATQGGTPCAVKLPLVGGRWTRWVYREAVALARLHHPGLPGILEVGEVDQVPYIVMELVDGETLAERLSRGPLDESATLKIGIQLAGALAAVHAIGIVHRDVKPGNIVLERDGRVRLVDFGFAVPIHAAAADTERAGTRGYAAPEQLVGHAPVDGRADLFAVGRVLQECLIPRAPRAAPDLGSKRLGEGARCEVLLAGLLASDPEDRYPDGAALLRELSALQRGAPPLGPGAYERERRAPVLVGRAAELERLNRCWAGVGTSGPRVALVQGAPGTGKSRLLEATASIAHAARGHRVLEVRCQQGDPPLALLQRVFRAFGRSFRHASPNAPEALAVALRAAVDERLAPFARLIAPADVQGLGPGSVTPEAAPGGFIEGAAELLLRLARSAGPLLLVVDDFQWADPVSRAAIARAAAHAHEAPLSLVLGARDAALQATWGPVATIDPARVSVVKLSGLDARQVAQLVALHLGVSAVPASIVQRIEALADGTPLGVLGVLGALLDSGAVRPHADGWRLDADRADRVALPPGAIVQLGNRLGELPKATRHVLDAAAVLGTTFDPRVLAGVVGLDAGALGYALADARQAGLIVPDEGALHRFVHDGLRETVTQNLDAATERELHQRVAELLDRPDSSFEVRCATARHYAAGVIEKSPAAVYRAARAAAEEALERFDNETALQFLDLASEATRALGLALDCGFHRSRGEASLRLGVLDQSLRSFEAALGVAGDARTRAAVLGRIAWVHQVNADPERAWTALAAAFASLSARMPTENVASAAATVGHVARTALLSRVRPAPAPPTRDERDRIELLSELHHQNARLGLEYGKPLRLVESTLEALDISATLGPARAHARVRAVYGLVLTALGRSKAGQRQVAEAQRMATELVDPRTYAYCVQVQAVSACYGGKLDRALALFRECVDVHGPWLELNEYCLDAATASHIESVRGRATEALAWSVRAIERQRQSPHVQAGAAEYLAHQARAALASAGRSAKDDPWLSGQVEAFLAQPGPEHSFYHQVSWSPRARFLLDTDHLGPELDALVQGFEANHAGRHGAHPTVAEYYIAIAHARVQQCLTAPSSERRAALRPLRRALGALRAVAKIPLYEAHRVFVEACVAWLGGSTRDARRLLLDAESRAEAETCPWILSEVARVRAHLLRDEGKLGAARDQALFAELLAREHGALPRARRIQGEFALPEPSPASRRSGSSSSAQSSNHARRQLTTLLHAVQKSFRELGVEEQAGAILEDLLADLGADRGFILFRPELGQEAPMILSRSRDGAAAVDASREALMQRVCDTGTPWPPADDVEAPPEGPSPGRLLVFPLCLHTRVVGAVCLERSPSRSPFGDGDRELLLLLSHQVPIGLEITRLLAERKQLQASLAQGQKLEATGRLAGGMAHDFNNMLGAIRGALEGIVHRPGLDPTVTEELQVISGATDRAAMLTGQLLSFSRHQPGPRSICRANALISDLAPMLERLTGSGVRLDLALDPALQAIKVDRTLFDQVIVNLVINASDAMPGGGTLRITTRNVTVDEGAIRRGAAGVGGHVSIEVADTGQGMNADVLARVFDPFFTTKPQGHGTGLGLTMVYAFVKNSGGFIEASSEVGAGTVFRMYFPVVADVLSVPTRRLPPKPRPVARAADRGKTILVVDDDPYMRRMMDRTLRRGHHAVLLAASGAEALRLAAEHRSDIGVVILDVVMPGMTGPETARHLARECAAKQLFMSGFAPEELPPDEDVMEFLQKPFSGVDLLARVRRLLDAR